MVGKKECDECGGEIHKDDKYVILSTISPKLEQRHYFHFTCFKKNHDQKVNQKARNIVAGMQGKAVEMLGSIQNRFGDIAGGDQLQQMLGIDLKAEIPKFEIPKVDPMFKKENKLPKLNKKEKNGKRRKKV